MSINVDEVIGNGNYKIIDSIGIGGMGEVYKALQMNLDRIVAIKIIHPHLVENREVLERFRKEARIQAKLIHPNIVTIYDFMETDQNYCIVMEYVQGESVSRIIKDQGPFDPVVSISMFRQILEGIKYAHSKGVVHKDIKSSNFIITPTNVKVTDFGIAQVMDDTANPDGSSLVGTPKYMSPEQILGQKLDQRSDIYSLGVTFYEMVSGRVPFNGDTGSDFEIKKAHIKEKPLNPSELDSQIPSWVGDFITRCLSRNPDDRFESVSEMINELDYNAKPDNNKVNVDDSSYYSLVKEYLETPKSDVDNSINDTEFDKFGDLKRISFPVLINSIYREARTGCLYIQADYELNIYFQSGYVVFVESKDPSLALGEMLFEKDRISKEDQNVALNFVHETGLKIGEALIRMGKITPHELNQLLEIQMKEKAVKAFSIKTGNYDFVDKDVIDFDVIYKINPIQIVYDGVMRYVDVDDLKKNLSFNRKSAVKPVNLIKEQLRGVSFTVSKEVRILDHLNTNTKSNIGEIIDLGILIEGQALKLLHFLNLLDFVEIENESSKRVQTEPPENLKGNSISIQLDNVDATVDLNPDEIEKLKNRLQ